ncbi:SIMPL domain-containing protein [Nocardia cyriacigeorgica]|uniref:SIMPL domain-containing protein n=1 Tax=Nocardia cyriacigeorgica TaxID=135487 RepID=UPI0018957CCB|nr:SIMPL domain-containing protein [Nocardia cyriacigeorgica]MBF6087856.1 SIMPL domain-containing protein [Nocardia cyriacigeorgica]MBF6094225.1 SIMPL domain-containing protein [Nocardia cyriacigeorgica]MBF6396137.1 SIMPL domain-containing protein [Nocardia cyriacigeorgica]MBF6401769.1 SIMPL domain-containing protein [Nocardia cyriacigeorgica]
MGKKKSSGAVTTFGHGTVRATPDLMRVTLSVESRASKVALAYGRAGERVSAVTDSLRSYGVPSTDIATSGLSVRAETVWVEGGGNKVTGYLATTSLTITLRDIGEDADPGPATIIAHCVDAGGDDVRLGGLELTVADPDAVLGAARDAAWDDAKAKAEQYAARAGRTLGAVIEITEDTSTPVPVPRPRMRGATEIAYAAAAVPVELGESELAADLRVTWELD